jgi:hypothetical protein
LEELLSLPVSSRQELRVCTYLLGELEDLGLNINSDAYRFKMQWQTIWKDRLDAQNSIDQWMVRHQPGTPVY